MSCCYHYLLTPTAQVIIMAFSCASCGYRNTQVQPAASDLGDDVARVTRLECRIETARDWDRLVLKSHTAAISVPEIDLELAPGTLGSCLTTVQGLLSQVLRRLEATAAFSDGDSAACNKFAADMTGFLRRLQDVLEQRPPITLIITDEEGLSKIEPVHDVSVDSSLSLRGGTGGAAPACSQEEARAMRRMFRAAAVLNSADRDTFAPKNFNITGPAPPAWPGPYVARWGLADATQPLRYGGDAEVLGLELSHCSFTGNVSGARVLLAQGVDVNWHDLIHAADTPLHRAAEQDHQEILQMLLAANASVNAENHKGSTPLLLAAAAGNGVTACRSCSCVFQHSKSGGVC